MDSSSLRTDFPTFSVHLAFWDPRANTICTRFKIKDDEIGRDSLAAWACIRLDRLQEGFRFVHLHDCTGEHTGGVLLVRVTKSIS